MVVCRNSGTPSLSAFVLDLLYVVRRRVAACELARAGLVVPRFRCALRLRDDLTHAVLLRDLSSQIMDAILVLVGMTGLPCLQEPIVLSATGAYGQSLVRGGPT